MSPDERRAMILDAAIPLLASQGAEVTTRQIAEAAGIAEGTIFRVFPDKPALIEAAVERFTDPAIFASAVHGLGPQMGLEERVSVLVDTIAHHMSGIMGLLHALGAQPQRNEEERREAFFALIEEALAPVASQLRVDPAVAARRIWLVAFSAAILAIHGSGSRDIAPVENLADFVLYGIAASKE
jgi:AcrR family transcriptional regulator